MIYKISKIKFLEFTEAMSPPDFDREQAEQHMERLLCDASRGHKMIEVRKVVPGTNGNLGMPFLTCEHCGMDVGAPGLA